MSWLSKYHFEYRTVRWRHNGHDGVSNHQPHHCLLKCLFGCRSKKTCKLRVTGLCAGNSPVPEKSSHKWPVTRKMFPFDDFIIRTVNIVRPAFHNSMVLWFTIALLFLYCHPYGKEHGYCAQRTLYQICAFTVFCCIWYLYEIYCCFRIRQKWQWGCWLGGFGEYTKSFNDQLFSCTFFKNCSFVCVCACVCVWLDSQHNGGAHQILVWQKSAALRTPELRMIL